MDVMNSDLARRIAQDVLDRQGEVTVAGDLSATMEWCDLPCVLVSLEGDVTARTEDEMRAICAGFIARLRELRITHMARRCLEAEFEDADTVRASYETRYVRDGHLLTDAPYVGLVLLRRRADHWRIGAMQFAVSGSSPANATLLSSGPGEAAE